jgi:hypothetical protein
MTGEREVVPIGATVPDPTTGRVRDRSAQA